MTRITRLVLVLMVGALAAMPHGAFAMTPIRSVAADTAPDPVSLLQGASDSLAASGTFHLTFDAQLPGTSEGTVDAVAVHATGDIDETHQATQMRTTATERGDTSVPATYRDQTVQIKGKIWHKSHQTKNRWKRGHAWFAYLWHFPFSFAPSPADISTYAITLTTVGLEHLHGVSVWHVHEDYLVRSGQPTPDTVDLYITQQGTIPMLAQAAAFEYSDGPIRSETAFSRLGEPLTIRAPKVGHSTP